MTEVRSPFPKKRLWKRSCIINISLPTFQEQDEIIKKVCLLPSPLFCVHPPETRYEKIKWQEWHSERCSTKWVCGHVSVYKWWRHLAMDTYSPFNFIFHYIYFQRDYYVLFFLDSCSRTIVGIIFFLSSW